MTGTRLVYTACMILAALITAWLLKKRQRSLSIDSGHKLIIGIGALVGATFAAKLPFILSSDPATGVLSTWISDGKTILWGLVGGYIGVELAKWSLRIQASTGDTFVIPVAIGVAIGRVGCLLYGCCYGVPTNQTWGMRFVTAVDGGTLLRHPTQVYEIIFHISFVLLAWYGISNGIWRRNWMPTYMVAYAAYRFISEWWRPEPVWLGGLTFYQWSAIAIGLGFAAVLIKRQMFGFGTISKSGDIHYKSDPEIKG